MTRIVASFALAFAASAAVVQTRSAAGPRNEVCQYCHKLCPISCFVGTCGLHTSYSVRKYEATNQCYSCDPAVSVGISKDGDMLRCQAAESGVTKKSSPFAPQQGAAQGPQGPAIPGNAGLAALKASKQAQLAVQAATRASIWADKAAKAATAKYREITGAGASGSNSAFSSEQAMENHQTATQIRAEEALRVTEATHTAWKAAMGKYNDQLALLRRQQIVTDQAEKTLEGAEMASERARGEYATMQAEAQRAIAAAMASGGSAASKITSQAAAEELAGAAMAAHRRLVIAAKEAKEASEKIAIATSMAPCTAMLLQVQHAGAPPIIGCMSIAQKKQQDERLAAPSITYMQPTLPQAPPPPSAVHETVEDLGFEADGPAMPTEGQLEIPSLEENMMASLAEKLENNPGAVSDASLFSVPQVPFSTGQTPVDGTEHVPSFDLSTISALQTGKHANLRQGNMQP